jgi:hypothetical protein
MITSLSSSTVLATQGIIFRSSSLNILLLKIIGIRIGIDREKGLDFTRIDIDTEGERADRKGMRSRHTEIIVEAVGIIGETIGRMSVRAITMRDMI